MSNLFHFQPIFKKGDVIASYAGGNILDKPVAIIEITVAHGAFLYKCLRLDPQDVQWNGNLCHYSEASIKNFVVLKHIDTIEVLF